MKNYEEVETVEFGISELTTEERQIPTVSLLGKEFGFPGVKDMKMNVIL